MSMYLKNKEVSFSYIWKDTNIFAIDIGDGDLTDNDGDDYFIHVEYYTNEDKYVFEIWWEDEYLNLNECKEEFLSEHEKEVIQEVMYHLMRQ